MKVKKQTKLVDKVKDGWRPPLEQKTCFEHGVWCCQKCIAGRDERLRQQRWD